MLDRPQFVIGEASVGGGPQGMPFMHPGMGMGFMGPGGGKGGGGRGKGRRAENLLNLRQIGWTIQHVYDDKVCARVIHTGGASKPARATEQSTRNKERATEQSLRGS